MLGKIIKMVTWKELAKSAIITGAKIRIGDNSAVKEKLGASSIDEFMRMDIHEYNQKKKGLV